jgi:NADH-quinone oxidoreductase subunit J
METYLFYLLATVTVVSALLVTLSRNAVNAAMFMILSLISTAGLFGLLGSYFLAALQVLVYAGAIMVLFVFIIMMVDVEEQARKRRAIPNLVAGLLASTLLGAGLIGLFLTPEFMQTLPELPESNADPMVFTGGAIAYGAVLFGKYMLPIQVMGFLLLLAMVGVILVSKNLWNRMEGKSTTGKP